MQKGTLGFIILVIAGLNLYWGARIYSLMSFNGSDEEMSIRRKQAAKLTLFSKLSDGVVLTVVALFWFIKGGWM